MAYPCGGTSCLGTCWANCGFTCSGGQLVEIMIQGIAARAVLLGGKGALTQEMIPEIEFVSIVDMIVPVVEAVVLELPNLHLVVVMVDALVEGTVQEDVKAVVKILVMKDALELVKNSATMDALAVRIPQRMSV